MLRQGMPSRWKNSKRLGDGGSPAEAAAKIRLKFVFSFRVECWLDFSPAFRRCAGRGMAIAAFANCRDMECPSNKRFTIA
jgi:hypothetical protein